MKYLCSILLVYLLFLGCTNNSTYQAEKRSQDSIRYENLIMSVALTYPSFRDGYYCSDAEKLKQFRFYLFSKTRHEIKDSLLGITIRYCVWDEARPVVHSKRIIYVSDNKNFEFVFPIDIDSYYFTLERKDTGNSSATNDLTNTGLDNDLNYIAVNLKINSYSCTKKLNRLMTLVMDSVLHYTEFSLRDTAQYRQLLEDEAKNVDDKECVKRIKSMLLLITGETKNDQDNIHYYGSTYKKPNYKKIMFIDGEFWKLELTHQTADTMRTIRSSYFINECFPRLYL